MAFLQRYPEELLPIKCLFIRKQYHPCINACLEALKMCQDDHADAHPLSEIFATFYLALAHDELARSMHEQSSFKLPTFTRAEQHYRQALKVLPTVEQCRSMLPTKLEFPDEAVDSLVQSLHSEASTEPPADTRESPPPSTPPVVKITTRIGRREPASPKELDSDTESHDSFDDIMTPHRVLKRDVSRMSLLDQPLQRDYSSMSLLDTRPKLNKSVSQGLLRPIRPGSPPRKYHLPPKLPYAGQSLHHMNVPKLHLSPPRGSSAPITKSSLTTSEKATPQRTPSPSRRPRIKLDLENASPVSSLGSAILDIEGSITSPISPQTPQVTPQQPTPDAASNEVSLDYRKAESSVDLTRLDEHIGCMRTQLQTHITLLQRTKLATTVAQAERASRSAMSANARMEGVVSGRGSSGTGHAPNRIPQSKSFWSFTPVDIKAAERKKRIEEGRARGWERKRYRSEKYVALAEDALAEL